jgi:sugar fermentation stimulation protein A
MIYPNIRPGIFINRPNRFIAHVEVEGVEEVCHVKNTGRCRELLIPGATVWLVESDNPDRKTRFDLVAVEKVRGEQTLLINMDSQAPNHIFREWAEGGNFRPGLKILRGETTFGNSRFDFYWEDSEKRGFVEIKGVTLEHDGVVRFPDAPTERGVKHLEELMAAKAAGYEAAVCFVVQMEGMRWLEPNDATHPAFGEALRRCAGAGVEVFALECETAPGYVKAIRPLPVKL